MKPILFAFTLLLSCSSLAQDSVAKEWKFKKQFEYWTKWQRYSYDRKAAMPAYIKNLRDGTTELPTSFDSITDNPLIHGATYLALKTQTDYKNNVSLFADLYSEHRGASYGLFDRSNVVVYPIARVEARDTLSVFSKQVIVKGKAGQFLNERLNEGLMIYNIDVQGMQIEAMYKGFTFQYALYGDLTRGIGLNINDLEAFSIGKNLNGSFNVGASWIISIPSYATLKNNYTLSVFANKKFKNTKIYSELSYRPFASNFYFNEINTANRSAFVAGIQTGKQNKKVSHRFNAELRYYAFIFNDFRSDYNFRYRKPATDVYSMYANTVGKYLYPLRKFETPFSQWAVFTEYQGFDIWMASITGDIGWNFCKKFAASVAYDFNYVQGHLNEMWFSPSSRTSSYLYPFFNAGLVYKPAEILQLKAALTNKTMNLDVSYPTHYLLKRPCFELSMTANFQ